MWPALRRVVAGVEAEGLHAAGFIAYEAAPGFDPALVVRGPVALPLLWFGLYRPPEVWRQLPAGGTYTLGGLAAQPGHRGLSPDYRPDQRGYRPRRHLPGELHHGAGRGLAG
ncbi:MAG: hypothetical protein V9H69_02875 [Anaerolineae bacterium]